MSRFWVHVAEHRVHHILVEAPSLLAALEWGKSEAARYVQDMGREDDECIGVFHTGTEMVPQEQLKWHGEGIESPEAVIDEDGKEILTEEALKQ